MVKEVYYFKPFAAFVQGPLDSAKFVANYQRLSAWQQWQVELVQKSNRLKLMTNIVIMVRPRLALGDAPANGDWAQYFAKYGKAGSSVQLPRHFNKAELRLVWPSGKGSVKAMAARQQETFKIFVDEGLVLLRFNSPLNKLRLNVLRRHLMKLEKLVKFDNRWVAPPAYRIAEIEALLGRIEFVARELRFI